MYLNENNCPTKEVLIDYFLEKLEQDTIRKISTHIYNCNKCIEFVRNQNYKFMKSYLLKAHPLVGEKLKALYMVSTFSIEVASSKNKKAHELISSDKKFKLILRPSKNTTDDAILEIYALEPMNINSNVNLFIETRLVEEIKLKNGYAFLFIDSQVDLSKIKLYYKR
jgi:hypothetical protein